MCDIYSQNCKENVWDKQVTITFSFFQGGNELPQYFTSEIIF